MRLLQINVDSALYSCGKICEDIAKVAQSEGWETYIAFGRERKDGVNKEIKIGNWPVVYEHYFENKFFDNEGLASRFATHKLVRKIEKINPDIIHLHLIHDHYINYRILFNYLAQTDIPVIWTQHDCWSFTGGCMYPDLYSCEQWKDTCLKCPYKRSLLFDQTTRQFKLKNKFFSKVKNLTLVPVSNWLGNLLMESFHCNRNIVTIHNGINIEIFRPYNNKSSEKFEIIGVAAVWDKRKGLEDFIKLRELLPAEKFGITLVGLLREQIKMLPDGIRGIERTHNAEELAKLYSYSNVYVNPTYSDNFPTTNIEALACGTPVITYQTGCSPESIDEQTGVIVKQGDINMLASEIIKMCDFPKLASDCRKRAEKLFDKDKCFRKYIDLYKKSLSQQDV